MKREKFQIIYIMTFIVSSFGVVGNMERDLQDPKWLLITFEISGFLSILKLIYCIKKDIKKLKKIYK